MVIDEYFYTFLHYYYLFMRTFNLAVIIKKSKLFIELHVISILLIGAK